MPPISLGLGLGLSRGGRPFHPRDLGTQLRLDLDPAMAASVVLNGSNVSGFADQSSYGLHFAQGTAGNQPPYDTSGAYPCVTVGGTRFLESTAAASAWRFLHESSSVFVVCESVSASPNDITALLATHDSGNGRGLACALEDRAALPANDRARMLVSNGTGAVIDLQTASDAVPAQVRSLVEYRYAPSAVLKATIIRNGVITAWAVALSAATPSGDPQGTARLGRFRTYTDGQPHKVYRALAFAPALSVADASRVRRYLGLAYALTISETGE